MPCGQAPPSLTTAAHPHPRRGDSMRGGPLNTRYKKTRYVNGGPQTDSPRGSSRGGSNFSSWPKTPAVYPRPTGRPLGGTTCGAALITGSNLVTSCGSGLHPGNRAPHGRGSELRQGNRAPHITNTTTGYLLVLDWWPPGDHGRSRQARAMAPPCGPARTPSHPQSPRPPRWSGITPGQPSTSWGRSGITPGQPSTTELVN